MPLRQPSIAELPSVGIALRWLLKMEGWRGEHRVVVRARALGLIYEREGRWSACDNTLERLLATSLRRLPTDEEQLGAVLHGLGEMAARSHAPLLDLITNYLQARRRRIDLGKALIAAVGHNVSGFDPPTLSELAFGQWVATADFSWGTFQSAEHRCSHPHRFIVGPHYGLHFVAKLIFRLNPNVIDDWIKKHRTHAAIPVIGDAAAETLIWSRSLAPALLLLSGRNAAIKCLAAASILFPPDRQTQLGLTECIKVFIQHRIDPGDAIWMAGVRIKNAIHSRYWTESQRDGSEARRRIVERDPDSAGGGRHNAEAELTISIRQRNAADERLSAIRHELEEMLSELAANWPNKGLSDEQMTTLDVIFVGTPEIRYRLAEKISHQGNRDRLLKRNLDQFREMLGLDKSREVLLQDYFHHDETTFQRVAPWTAASLVLLYQRDRRGSGRRTGDVIGEITTLFDELDKEAFIAGRRPTAWQSVVGRAACAHRFALMVVVSAPISEREPLLTLSKMATEHARKLLSARNPDTRFEVLLDHLTLQAIHQMAIDPEPNDVRARWALCLTLPDFPRAAALWASPGLVEVHRDLAFDLFRQVGRLPLSYYGRDQQLNRLLGLLDVAIAYSAIAGKKDFLSEISAIWADVYKSWQPITGEWSDIANTLVGAVAGDEFAQEALSQLPAFQHSCCKRFLDGTKEHLTGVVPKSD